MSMSEGQKSAATLSRPNNEDIEVVHQIVLRAQQEPLGDDRLSLLNAYKTTFTEHGWDHELDNPCHRLILEILKPDVEGDRLYTKFENILRDRGMEIWFSDDETSTKDTVPSSTRDNYLSRRHSVQSSSVSVGSYEPSHGPMQGTDRYAGLRKEWEKSINNPSPLVMQLMRKAINMDRHALVRQCIQMFQEHQRAQQLRVMEQTAGRIYERSLKFKVLSHWYNLQQQVVDNYGKAHAHYIQHKASSTLDNILDSARVNRMHAMEDERLRGMSLYKMTMAARESNFCRKRNFWMKQKYMRLMLNNSQSRSANGQTLETLLNQLQPRFNTRLLRTATAAILSTSNRLDSSRSLADVRCELKLKSSAMNELVRKSQHMSSNAISAQNFRQQFLMRKYVTKMKESVRNRVLRQEALMQKYFRKWQHVVQRMKQARLKALHFEYRRRFKMKLARKVLTNMTDKARYVQSLQTIAIESQTNNANRFAHDIVVKWYNKSHQFQGLGTEAAKHADDIAVKRVMKAVAERWQRLDHLGQTADQFHHLHTQGVSTNCLKTLKRRLFEVTRRQQDADAFRHRHNRHVARTLLDRMRRKAAENRGEGPLILPPATPAQRRADELIRLASTTPLLAPRTSFAARLRGEAGSIEDADEETDDDG